MSYYLFLDDKRFPRNTPEYRDFPIDFFRKIKIARNCREAIEIITEFGLPAKMMLDYDLGEDIHTGMDVVNYFISLVKDCPSALDPDFEYFIHSNSQAGTVLMREALDNFLKEMRKL